MNGLMCLIKFSDKRNDLESLMNKGEIFFNRTQAYTDSSEPERGDSNEGAVWIENAEFTNIKAEHPTLGTFNFTPKKDHFSHFTTFEKLTKHDELIMILPDACKELFKLLEEDPTHYSSLKKIYRS